MRIYCAEDYQGMSRRVANIIAAQLVAKPTGTRNPAVFRRW